MDLEQILIWRNQEHVRNVMLDNHIITLDEHLNWWKNVDKDDSQQWHIYSFGSIDYGVVYVSDIDNIKKSAHWGFYLKNLDNKNGLEKFILWQKMETESLNYIFNIINIEKLICTMLASNDVVIKQHRRFGFKEFDNYFITRSNKKELVIKMVLDKQTYLSRQ